MESERAFYRGVICTSNEESKLNTRLGVKPDGVTITPHLINYSLYRVKVTSYLE